jgi:hypothetical protein
MSARGVDQPTRSDPGEWDLAGRCVSGTGCATWRIWAGKRARRGGTPVGTPAAPVRGQRPHREQAQENYQGNRGTVTVQRVLSIIALRQVPPIQVDGTFPTDAPIDEFESVGALHGRTRAAGGGSSESAPISEDRRRTRWAKATNPLVLCQQPLRAGDQRIDLRIEFGLNCDVHIHLLRMTQARSPGQTTLSVDHCCATLTQL